MSAISFRAFAEFIAELPFLTLLGLFNAPLLRGLASRSAIVDEKKEQTLVSAIDATGLTPFRCRGWTRQAADKLHQF